MMKRSHPFAQPLSVMMDSPQFVCLILPVTMMFHSVATRKSILQAPSYGLDVGSRISFVFEQENYAQSCVVLQRSVIGRNASST